MDGMASVFYDKRLLELHDNAFVDKQQTLKAAVKSPKSQTSPPVHPQRSFHV